MDTAVALVQAYLHVNGYFTVTEYPVVEVVGTNARSRTDLDILAFRFIPGSGARHDRHDRLVGDLTASFDAALDAPEDQSDMIIGEVKEGSARFNPAVKDPQVIACALIRFGCCKRADADATARALLNRRRVITPCGHVVRLVAFGGVDDAGDRGAGKHHVVSMRHIVSFLIEHVAANRNLYRTAQSKHPALAWLTMLDKLREGYGRDH
jgi:hypothetical protein